MTTDWAMRARKIKEARRPTSGNKSGPPLGSHREPEVVDVKHVHWFDGKKHCRICGEREWTAFIHKEWGFE